MTRKASVARTLRTLQKEGCDVNPGGNGHWRVTYRDKLVGSVSGSPHTEVGLEHSLRKIRARIALLETTGRTY